MSSNEENSFPNEENRRKMDGNNNNRIAGGGRSSTPNQLNFPVVAAPSPYYNSSTAAHDLSFAQILYYQNILKQQANVSNSVSKMQSRNNITQHAVINNPSILPQVPGSPTNRSFANALRNLAKQITPDQDCENVDGDSAAIENETRQVSPSIQMTSSLLQSVSPPTHISKCTGKDKGTSTAAAADQRSGFQPYRAPDESRTALPSTSQAMSAPPYVIDPGSAAAAAAAANYHSYQHAAAAAAAAAAYYPASMQPYRLEEQLYLERCGVPMFPPSPYASHPLYGMMPGALGLMSPTTIHERLKLEEEQRQRELHERDRMERDKREKNKRSPRASPSHGHLPEHAVRKASIATAASNAAVNPQQQQQQLLQNRASPLQHSGSSSSAKIAPPPPRSSPTSTAHLSSSAGSAQFMRPFEDAYAMSSSSSSATAAAATKTKPPLLASFAAADNGATTCVSQNAGYNAYLNASKLSANLYECYKTPDSVAVEPPSAHLSSQGCSAYANSVAAAAAAPPPPPDLNSFHNADTNPTSTSSSFKPFSSYPYDLIQHPPFKNHMIDYMALSSSSSSSLSTTTKKPRLMSSPIGVSGGANDYKEPCTTNNNNRSSKSRTAKTSNRPASRSVKTAAEKKKNVACTADSSSVPLNLSTSVVPALALSLADNATNVDESAIPTMFDSTGEMTSTAAASFSNVENATIPPDSQAL